MGDNRDWMYFPRRLPEFEAGVNEFLDASFAKSAIGGEIHCPCKRCRNRYWGSRKQVKDHLIGQGFVRNYYLWSFHGEVPQKIGANTVNEDDTIMHDNMDELLHDRFHDSVKEANNVDSGLNEEAKKFYRLVEEGKQELFSGCKTFSKLSFMIRLLLYKTLHGLSNVAFDDLLKLLKEIIPEMKIPSTFTQAKSIVSEQAHRYALFNSDCTEIDEYINEHQRYIDSQPRKSRWARAQNHSYQFADWLRDKVINNNVSDHIFWLAKGPSPTSRRFNGYYVKGYRFHTKSRDDRCKTQNSGVSLTALTPSFASSRDKNPVLGNVEYYGRVLEIIELDYWSKFKVVLFRCEWYQIEKNELGLSCVNFNKLCCSDDPFVMPSQVHQVFYVPDPIKNSLHYVVNKVARDLFDFEEESSENVADSYWCEPNENGELLRNDMPPVVVDANSCLADVDEVDYKSDESDYDDTLWDWMTGDEDNVDDI